MSDTAIESLIEDSVGAVLRSQVPASEKRQMICALYEFHDRFDTSFTMGRHLAGLRHLGFEEPTPETGLLPKDPPLDCSLSELALRSVKLCSEGELALDWYACLTSRYLEFDLDEEFLATLSSLEADVFLHELRELAMTAGLSTYRKSKDSLFPLCSWATERDSLDPSDADRYHISRYLLDPKANLQKIRKAFEKDRKANSPEARSALYGRIEEALAPVLSSLDFQVLPRVDDEREIRWLWHRDRLAEDESTFLQREFLLVTLDLELAGLELKAGVQQGEVLAWQQSEPAFEPAFWHFYSNLFADVEESSPTYKTLNNFGMWPLKPGMAAKTEAKRLGALTEQVELLVPQVFELYSREFRDRFFERPAEWFEEQWEDVVPTEVLVSFPGDVWLLRAYKARAEGDEKRAQLWFDAAEKRVSESHPKGMLRKYLEPKIKEMRENIEAPLTLLMHSDSLKYLRDCADA